ncbi:sugar ABC transporter permease [Kitasatospora sp. NPDC001547]|uniref:sugar ABC transporter permease n=1 Tax=Kitasatospora sp. NPDC001547 TaxID=3364015 RepID=UPI00367DC636
MNTPETPTPTNGTTVPTDGTTVPSGGADATGGAAVPASGATVPSNGADATDIPSGGAGAADGAAPVPSNGADAADVPAAAPSGGATVPSSGAAAADIPSGGAGATGGAAAPASGTDAAGGAVPAVDPRLHQPPRGWAAHATAARHRLARGELGSLPVVVGLIVIAAVFQSVTHHFLQADNLTNITRFIAGPGLIAVGVVFVLILGEIDLSLGSVAGASAALAAVLAVRQDLPEWLAILTALGAACAMGLLHGFFFARVGVPAFVVTLAGMLAWNGLQEWVLGDAGTVNNRHHGIIASLDTTFLGDGDIAYAWTLAALAPALYLTARLRTARRRRAAGLTAPPTTDSAIRAGALAALTLTTAYTLNQDRGLPLSLVVLLTAVLTTDFVLRRTRYGRQVLAIGGNVEAARRAGINITRTRTTVFILAAFLAALGGLFYASQQGSADKQLGSGNVLMSAIAAAVIGGTSLFGGRGNTRTALLGILVIQTITTGLDMIHATQAIQYMITGTVLLTAVTLDSLTRHTHTHTTTHT